MASQAREYRGDEAKGKDDRQMMQAEYLVTDRLNQRLLASRDMSDCGLLCEQKQSNGDRRSHRTTSRHVRTAQKTPVKKIGAERPQQNRRYYVLPGFSGADYDQCSRIQCIA